MRVAALVSLVGALSLASGAAAATSKPAAPPKRGAHPATGGVEDCRGCHARATPAAFEAWSRGKHGEVLVTCVVCHGSTGADFARRPAPDRCAGCHPEEAATKTARAGQAKTTCYTCHPAHALDPHGARRTATDKTRDVTRTDLSAVAFPNQGVQSVPLAIQPAAPAAPPGGAAPSPAATPTAPAR